MGPGTEPFAQCARPKGGWGRGSVSEDVDVVVEADGGAGGAVAWAALRAAAALNPHEVVVEGFSVRTLEAQPDGAGQGGRAAAAVGARPAGTRAVPRRRRAAGERYSDRIMWATRSLALLSPLADIRELQVTLSDLAQSGFPDQLTVWVVIGHAS